MKIEKSNNISLKFEYKFSDDYNPIYVNGAYGGVNPRGEIIANFYLERNPIPYTEVITLDDDGNFLNGEVVNPENHQLTAVRYVSTGIVMNLENAKAFHEWLGVHIKKLEEGSE